MPNSLDMANLSILRAFYLLNAVTAGRAGLQVRLRGGVPVVVAPAVVASLSMPPPEAEHATCLACPLPYLAAAAQ